MSPWSWMSSLGRASLEGGLLIVGVWVVCRSWRGLPAWARSGLWWLASARLLIALAPWTAISVPVPLVSTGWPAAVAMPPPAAPVRAIDLAWRAAATPSASVDTPSRAASIPPASHAGFYLRRLEPRTLGWALLVLWAAGVLVRLAGMARQFARVRRFRRAAVPDGALVPATLVAAKGVRIALHEEVPAPMVTGLVRPLVLLPAAMASRPGDDLRLAVAHELSHVRRGDLWLAWIPALAEALFWFHPLVSFCAREYVQACEEACDEDALRATGAHPYEYGRLLLALGIDRRWTSAGAIAFGSRSPRQLVRRLSMLKHAGPLSPRARTAASSLVCAFALVGLAPIRVVPAASAPAVAAAIATIEAPAVAEGATGGADATAPATAASVATSLVTGAAIPAGASSSRMENEPPPPDDPEVTPSPDDHGDDLDQGPDVDEDPAMDSDEAVPPTPPTPPAPPRVPRPPMAPRSAYSGPAPRAELSPRARSSYRYSYSDGDTPSSYFAYVLVHGDQESMTGSGNTLDWREAHRLKAQTHGDFLWVRVGDRKYLIEDSDLLRQIEVAYAPQTELGERQSRLGEAQSQIGEQQSKLGEAQSRVGEAQSEVGQRQREMAQRMARRQARGEDASDLARMASELSDQMETLSRQQERLSARMEPLSRQQEQLGSQMEELGRQMERISRTADHQVRGLIDRAIHDGDARPLR